MPRLAKRTTTCPVCGEQINPGDLVFRWRGIRDAHSECIDGSPMSPEPDMGLLISRSTDDPVVSDVAFFEDIRRNFGEKIAREALFETRSARWAAGMENW